MGFAGVQNFPTVGVIDGNFRRVLEETGLSYQLEVEMIRVAHAKNLLTTPYVFDTQEAIAMTQAGADLLVAHFGTTVGGSIGAETSHSLEACAIKLDEWAEAAMQMRQEIIVICHGDRSRHRKTPPLCLRRADIVTAFMEPAASKDCQLK